MRVSDILEPELQAGVNCHVSAWNRTQVLWKSSSEPSPQPKCEIVNGGVLEFYRKEALSSIPSTA